ncbi:MAG: FMN-binding protein [Candidatus Eisenbacteria bacterium]
MMLRLTFVLALICLVAALALGFVYRGTAPMIEKQKMIIDELARRSVLPEALCGAFVPVETNGFVYYKGYRNADTTGLVGYTVTARGRGYSSTIETIVGVDLRGRITGMRITSEKETPGLGTRIEEVKSARTVLDALKAVAGRDTPKKLVVEIGGEGSARHAVEAEIRDAGLCAEVEEALARGDTAEVTAVAARAIGVTGADAAMVFADPALTCELCDKVIKRLRSESTPWFQSQFVGKSRAELVLAGQATDKPPEATSGATPQSQKTWKPIQAIAGATISSRAVAESVRNAIVELDKATSGFQEVTE